MPPWLFRLCALKVVLPLLTMRPALLSMAPVAVMRLAPVPLCTISPARLLRVVVLMVMFCALVLALSRLTAPALKASAPLLVMCPRWPLKAPVLATLMAKVPLPACSILPSVLASVCADRVRFCALLA